MPLSNISDQLTAYSEDAAFCIKDIQKRFDLEYSQAAIAVFIGTMEMVADALHKLEFGVSQIPGCLDGRKEDV